MFWWLIWVLIFIILIANERHSWTDTFWEGNSYAPSHIFRRRNNDADRDMSRNIQKQVTPEVVVVTADDLIERPDGRMEKLIKEGRLEEARKYRLDMEKISESMGDDEGMKKYAVYGARISRRQKEINALKSKQPYRAVGRTASQDDATSAEAGVPPIWKRKSGMSPATPEPLISKPAPIRSEPVKPEPPKLIIPEGFTPPPPGPVKLGSIGGYQPGHGASENSDGPEKEKVEDTPLINPDDYNELISL